MTEPTIQLWEGGAKHKVSDLLRARLTPVMPHQNCCECCEWCGDGHPNGCRWGHPTMVLTGGSDANSPSATTGNDHSGSAS